MATLILDLPEFNFLKIEKVIPTSLNFSGKVEGYPSSNNKSFNSISFKIEKREDFHSVLEKIQRNYKSSEPIESRVRAYLETDHPKIVINFQSGERGWADSPSIYFQ